MEEKTLETRSRHEVEKHENEPLCPRLRGKVEGNRPFALLSDRKRLEIGEATICGTRLWASREGGEEVGGGRRDKNG